MSDAAAAYRKILQSEFRRLCARNPRYSLRSFARDLELAPSRVSEVLAGKQGLSRESAERVTRRLKFSDAKAAEFCDLVTAAHGRSVILRTAARDRLQRRDEERHFARVRQDGFALIGNWYHFAILELTEVRGFRSEIAWIAHTLGLDEQETFFAVQRLIRLGLLEQVDGHYRCAKPFTEWASAFGIPPAVVEQFHAGILERARRSFKDLPIEKRDHSATVFAFDSARQAEAEAELKRFRRRFCLKYGSAPEGAKTGVHTLAVHFFSLTPGTERLSAG